MILVNHADQTTMTIDPNHPVSPFFTVCECIKHSCFFSIDDDTVPEDDSLTDPVVLSEDELHGNDDL